MYLKRKLGPPIVVVSGLPRSGTSMMMKMLDAGGLEIVTDRERSADEDNPKGYFELERVKELDKDGADKSWMRDHRGRVVKVISFLLKDLPDDCEQLVVEGYTRLSDGDMVRVLNEPLANRTANGP